MAKTKWTTAQAAEIGGCHGSTISRLCRRGVLRAEKVVGRRRGGRGGTYVIVGTRAEIREAVMKAVPRCGYHKNSGGATTRAAAPSDGLSQLKRWLALSQEERDAALALAEKFTAKDLGVLSTL